MLPDKSLIKRVGEIQNEKLRNAKLVDLEEYIVACELSQGKDPNRSEHWTVRAMHMKNALLIACPRIVPDNEIET
jgi:hypothetical protein